VFLKEPEERGAPPRPVPQKKEIVPQKMESVLTEVERAKGCRVFTGEVTKVNVFGEWRKFFYMESSPDVSEETAEIYVHHKV